MPYGTLFGISMSDTGLQKLGTQVAELRQRGDGRVRTSIVSGKDWSVGRSGTRDDYRCLRAVKYSGGYAAAVTCQAWAMLNSVYVVGTTVYAQLGYGMVQCGGLHHTPEKH